MPHPVTKLEIIAALESNAESCAQLFSSLPDRPMFDGDPDHWSPAHHLVHLTQANVAVERALRSGALPFHPAAQSRTYAEVRNAATASLAATSSDRLRDMGRRVTIAPGTAQTDVLNAFAT